MDYLSHNLKKTLPKTKERMTLAAKSNNGSEDKITYGYCGHCGYVKLINGGCIKIHNYFYEKDYLSLKYTK